MKIESLDLAVRGLLRSSYYMIPRFQRPYSWDKENVEDFWMDAVQESSGDYFIGAMVVYPASKDMYSVVDGQQRITTLVLLLCAIREAFTDRGLEELSEGTHGFIERPDEDNQLQYVLQTETSHPYLQDRILTRSEQQLSTTPGAEERALAAAYERLRDYLAELVASVEENPTIPKEKKPDLIRAELKLVRDKVLDLLVIFVEVDNQDDATLIFETLNARGKDLTVADLVKTHLLGYLKQRNKGLDPPRLKWEGIINKFDASQIEISPTAFLLAVWQSRYEYVSEKKLFKAVKSTMKRGAAASFLDLLVHEAEIYRQLIEPGYRKWPKSKEFSQAAASLRFFQDFRVRQPMPMLMSLLRDADAGKLKPKQLSRAFSLIECFHFGFTTVAQKSSSGGWSFLYARLARELLGKPKERKAEVIDELEEKLAERFPDLAEFSGPFSEIGFSDEFTQQKRLVQYVLRRFYEQQSNSAHVDPSRMTIEHLLSQSEKSAKHTAMLGNLLWVSDELNAELANKPVEEKLELLRKQQSTWIPPEILASSDWTDADIEARTSDMAEYAYEHIWTL